MIAKADLSHMYETVLSIPGMNEKVRIDLKMPLRNVLILSKAIERGLSLQLTNENSFGLMDFVSPESTEEILGISAEMLQKAGLLELNEKLKKMTEK